MMKSTYNHASAIQTAATNPMVPLIDSSVASNIALKVCDFGCAHGKTSIILFSRLRNRATEYVFNDRPENDFEKTRETVYAAGYKPDDCVFVPRSFYHRIFPLHSLDLGLSSSSLHWLSEMPHISSVMHWLGPVNAATVTAAAIDWLTFLQHRALELKPRTGKLILQLPCLSTRQATTSITMHGVILQKVLDELDIKDVKIPIYLRTTPELLAPLKVLPLKRLSFETRDIPCAFKEQWLVDGNTESFAKAMLASFRAWSESTLIACVGTEIADKIYERMYVYYCKSDPSTITHHVSYAYLHLQTTNTRHRASSNLVFSSWRK